MTLTRKSGVFDTVSPCFERSGNSSLNSLDTGVCVSLGSGQDVLPGCRGKCDELQLPVGGLLVDSDGLLCASRNRGLTLSHSHSHSLSHSFKSDFRESKSRT